MSTEKLMELLTERANSDFDGRFAVVKFTTTWRVGFGTPVEGCTWEKQAVEMVEGKTF
jgi:hypothetical protein